MNVLFLDIDGVLNKDKIPNNNLEVGKGLELDPNLIYLLKSFLDNHGSFKVVIISSWIDTFSLDEFKKIFKRFNLEIFDTIRNDLAKSKGIEFWIKSNGVSNFLILDDDILFDLKHPFNKKQVKTSLYLGLSERNINQMIDIVNNFSKK